MLRILPWGVQSVVGVPEVVTTSEPGPEYWERLLQAGPYYDTVEQLRDVIDDPNWRERDAARRIAEKRLGEPPRAVPDSLGTVARRAYRQVNVKLSKADFDILASLAVDRDVPVATMARMLLRQAVTAAT